MALHEILIKYGIVPYNPNVVLGRIQERRPETPPAEQPSLSPFGTPRTVYKLNQVGSRILEALPDDLDPQLASGIQRYIRGAEYHATQLIQTRRDLARTKLADESRRAARWEKNVQLQRGGAMTVAGARAMVRDKEGEALKKAEALVKASEEKERKKWKQLAIAACKAGRERKRRLLRQRRFWALYLKMRQPQEGNVWLRMVI